MNSQTFLVPVNFSDSSYKAVEYAMLLAKICHGSVQLLHVIDAQDVVESANPIVVSRSIDRLTKQAETRMRSLCEIIAETYYVPVQNSIAFGRVESVLVDEINSIKPDVVVLGKKNGHSYLVKKILSRISMPVFIVPCSTRVQEPSRIILTTDLKPVKPEVLSLLVELSKKAPEALSLLHIQKRNSLNGKNINQIATQLGEKLNVNTQFLLERYKEIVTGILNHTQLNCADLLCAVKRDKGVFNGLFSNSISTQLALQSEVPTLVVSDALSSN